MSNIEKEKRFKVTLSALKNNIPFKNFIEIGGIDASFKNYISHESWQILDKYGSPDIRVNLDGRDAKLPFKDNSIECFILTEVLEHLRMGMPLMNEIQRCLQKNGVLLISVPNMVSLANRLWWMLGKVPPQAASSDCGKALGGTGLLIDNYWEGGHVVDFNKNRFQKYVERSGLKLQKFYHTDAEIFKKTIFPRKLTPISLGDFLIATFKKK
ncbi:MAG: methyltransferase domain-containing protein [Flavobacteriaceae bacterium]